MFGALTGVLGVVGNLVTLVQAPSFWTQAICGPIILGSLMVTRFARGQSQE
jgi:ribose/xylose/arabinose/galactoside ABC-type transport system permease subunit